MTAPADSERLLLSGNEAVARAARDGAVDVATAYPGTPSTEILENIARHYPEIDAEWAPNEKVALEVGMGAAFTGARVLVTMKHVGVNVAADPLFTLAYTGTKGGIVIVSADDPGMHSSQNEQDNRHYAPFAQVPMLEPADSQEAYDFTRLALGLSEEFDTPVLLRMTTRVCHGKSVVVTAPPEKLDRSYAFERDQRKYVMVPAFARERHVIVKQRTKRLQERSDQLAINRIENLPDGANSQPVGYVTSGVASEYLREVAPEAPTLKIGMTHPLPEARIRSFAGRVKKLVVVEEQEPYLEERLRLMGLRVTGKPEAMRLGELTPDLVAEAIGTPRKGPEAPADAPPPRPPVLCPGCPHRAVYAVLKRMKLFVTGDIGCYTLGALPPLSCVDTCVCMGAGMGHAHGMAKVLSPEDRKKVVAVIGDSTFVHSGLTALVDMVYNQGDCTVLILDNGTTAMTGRQDHPATGRTLMGSDTPTLNLEAVSRAIGVGYVRTVNPWNIEESRQAIEEAIAFDGPAVVIEKGPCLLIDRRKKVIPMEIDPDLCKACGLCARTGCPAIREEGDVYRIDASRCRGCELCYQLCRFGAIHPMQTPGEEA